MRAEPISALFEQNRAHLVGGYPELEDQLCTFSAGSSGSPDRLDAMVWGITELMITVNHFDGWLDYMKAEAERANEAWQFGAEKMVKLKAPASVSHAQLWSGRHVVVPPDRIVTMAE